MTPNQENFYWLFSSAAQAIATFVAFLLTGYAVVLNLMSGLEEKDDTLVDILHELKRKYYHQVVALSITTGLAIITNLLMVYLNAGTWCGKPIAYSLSLLLDLLVIALGILFVISMINPNRYKIAAQDLIKKDVGSPDPSVPEITDARFTHEFIDLEKATRAVLQKRQLYDGSARKMVYSFAQMAQALYQNELITQAELRQLLVLNRFRNLVVHGHQDRVSPNMMSLISDAKKIIDRL